MQIKITLRYYLIPIRMVTIKRTESNMYWWGYREIGTLVPIACTVAGNVKWCSHYGKQYGASLNRKHNYHVIQQPYSWVYSYIYEFKAHLEERELDTYMLIAGLFTLFTQEVKVSHMSVTRWMDKENVVYTHSGILCGIKQERNTVTFYNVHEPWRH